MSGQFAAMRLGLLDGEDRRMAHGAMPNPEGIEAIE
jgi:hypothetical protein